ncbi:MAG: biotin transporter BioY [Candidatus Izemoplasmatales bacterium]
MTRTRRLAGTAVFTALAAVSVWLIPPFTLPGIPVAFTLQSFFVVLAGFVLPPAAASAAMLGYVALGAAGLPVFAGGTGGLSVLVGPSGAFLWLFPAVAGAIALAVRGTNRTVIRIAAGIGFAILGLYPLASLWTAFVAGIPWLSVLFGMTPYAVLDVVKVVLAAMLAKRLRRIADQH